MSLIDVILKRFGEPDEVREMSRGRFEIVHIGGMTIGRATYEPGWKWSVPSIPHDSWVIGEEPYVSLHFLGAESYAK